MPPFRLARTRLAAAAGALALATTCGSAWAAFEFTGSRSLTALTADGGRIAIGTVHFQPPVAAGQPATFRLALQHDRFEDHFLSMREFKCLPSPREVTCHVPYPHANPATVGPGRLAWLEHSLLFFFKTPSDFGAKLWNGVYFELREQGRTLVGEPKAVDLNAISAPPPPGAGAPLGPGQRHEMPVQARWLRGLVIE